MGDNTPRNPIDLENTGFIDWETQDAKLWSFTFFDLCAARWRNLGIKHSITQHHTLRAAVLWVASLVKVNNPSQSVIEFILMIAAVNMTAAEALACMWVDGWVKNNGKWELIVDMARSCPDGTPLIRILPNTHPNARGMLRLESADEAVVRLRALIDFDHPGCDERFIDLTVLDILIQTFFGKDLNLPEIKDEPAPSLELVTSEEESGDEPEESDEESATA